MSASPFYDLLRFHVGPPVCLVVFTLAAQLFVNLGNPDNSVPSINLGSAFAWKVVAVFYVWAFASQKVPGKRFKGPPAPRSGFVPEYAANGLEYFVLSIASFSLIVLVRPEICKWIYDDFASILSCLNLSALTICTLLLAKGKYFPDAQENDAPNLPMLYLYFRGAEMHPRFLDVDVKQWAICRVGMMGWALLVINFALVSVLQGTSSLGIWINASLITIYLLKFFYWETGYFDTLDVIYDQAGYYLCWGCICWVQAFYTFSTYYMVAYPSRFSTTENVVVFALGLLSLGLNYEVDREKEVFKTTAGKCSIWGRPAKTLPVAYSDAHGKPKKSQLLISGFWGVARHTNYTFELVHCLTWSLPAAHHGLLPFAYVFYLLALFVHRTFRDDEKCIRKYGDGWRQYCQLVPYKLIPYVY